MKDPLGRVLLRWRIREVLPHVKGRLLDIGCGTNELVRRYGDGVGVDVHQWGDVDFVVENTAKLPLEDESFDTVTIVAALNHIPNREEVLIEARRVLRAGGRIVVTMIPPGISRIWHAIREPWDVDQTERGMKEGEVYGITQRDLRKLLTDAGYSFRFAKPFMLRINSVSVAEKPTA